MRGAKVYWVGSAMVRESEERKIERERVDMEERIRR
jgi:hypothetical protein